MEEFISEGLLPLVAVILTLGIPIVVIVMVNITKMKKDREQKEIRQLIIENKTDPETAKLLIDEPKPQKKEQRKLGPFNLESLRSACILLGLGLGALINWALEPFGFGAKDINFWIILAFGIGIGLLCSFLVEMHLYKKYGDNTPKDGETPASEQ